MAFSPKRFSKTSNNNGIDNINHQSGERHPQLNYLLDAPTPYCLSLEEIYGHIPVITEKDINPEDPYGEVAVSLSKFLVNEVGTNGDGVRPSMDEYTFVRTYLPRFYNGHIDDYSSEKDFSIAGAWKWSVAGTGYQAVDILRNGELLFRVPPLLGSLEVMKTGEHESLTNMYMELRGQMDIIPHNRPRYESSIIDRFNDEDHLELKRTEKMAIKNLKNLFVLDEIFTYYGYESILTPEIMSIKSEVMGGNNGSKSVGTVSSVRSESTNPNTGEFDEDDLFG